MKTIQHVTKQYLDPRFNEILKWVIAHILDINPKLVQHCTDYWCKHVIDLLSHHGPKATIKRIKTYRLHVTRYLCGTPLLINSDNVRIDKSGIPSGLGPLKALVQSKSNSDVRLLLTYLLISRSIDGGHKAPDLSPITTESTCVEFEVYREEIRTALKDLRIPLCQSPPK